MHKPFMASQPSRSRRAMKLALQLRYPGIFSADHCSTSHCLTQARNSPSSMASASIISASWREVQMPESRQAASLRVSIALSSNGGRVTLGSSDNEYAQ